MEEKTKAQPAWNRTNEVGLGCMWEGFKPTFSSERAHHEPQEGSQTQGHWGTTSAVWDLWLTAQPSPGQNAFEEPAKEKWGLWVPHITES